MRGINSGCVDLIYLDPPFNSNRDYAAPIGSEAAGAAFKDSWTLSDVDEVWHGEVAERQPALYAIIDAAGLAHGKGMKVYLIMMAVRLMEMRRLLKPTWTSVTIAKERPFIAISRRINQSASWFVRFPPLTYPNRQINSPYPYST